MIQAATILWMLMVETSPDIWAAPLSGGYETIIALAKAGGITLAILLAFRHGPKTDRFSPAFAYAAMFITGLAHGLYPGLSLLSSLRSLLGSAAPFAFGFAKLPPAWCRAVIRTAIAGPAFVVIFGLSLQAAGIHPAYDFATGALRLGGSGEPPFLAGFTLIGIYAGLLEFAAGAGRRNLVWLAVNFAILIATGARAPLAIAILVSAFAFFSPGAVTGARARLMGLAGVGAAASAAIIFASQLSFIRVFQLAEAGQAASLSNRDLVWPMFESAFARSPWLGWGMGAGKYVLPNTDALSTAIGTNAAHNEYLRIGVEGGALGLALLIALLALWAWRGSRHLPLPQRALMRVIFIAFALHSATDNTLIATTSSIFFIWAAAVFATATQTPKPAP
jgi:O-antigen ligase